MARESRSLSRRAGSTRELETIAVVCEGKKTEDIYFNGIRKEFRLATAQLHVVGLGADPMRVVEEAESLREHFDHVWAVFDVEAPQPHERSLCHLPSLLRTLAHPSLPAPDGVSH